MSSPLGQEIRYQRRLAGLSQKQVAAKIGVTHVQFHRYEAGTTQVTTGRLVAIADAIGVRPEVLLNAATKPAVAPTFASQAAGPSQDMVTLLETFMAIKEPSHRDAFVALARMMTSSAPQPAQAAANAV